MISAEGEQLGIMSSRDAQLMARDAGLDLVEISANANPPVVKIIDWGKYQYQKMKEQSRAKKKAKSSELKQIRLGLKIGENDLNIKVRKVLELLEDGDRVKIMIVFRGREMAHKEIGTELMNRIIEKLGDQVIVDGKSQMSGRNLTFMVRHKYTIGKTPTGSLHPKAFHILTKVGKVIKCQNLKPTRVPPSVSRLPAPVKLSANAPSATTFLPKNLKPANAT